MEKTHFSTLEIKVTQGSSNFVYTRYFVTSRLIHQILLDIKIDTYRRLIGTNGFHIIEIIFQLFGYTEFYRAQTSYPYTFKYKRIRSKTADECGDDWRRVHTTTYDWRRVHMSGYHAGDDYIRVPRGQERSTYGYMLVPKSRRPMHTSG